MNTLDKLIQAKYPRYLTNEGHGHVWPRPDGVRARRTGNVTICAVCRDDQTELNAAKEAVADDVTRTGPLTCHTLADAIARHMHERVDYPAFMSSHKIGGELYIRRVCQALTFEQLSQLATWLQVR
jgi:hypothetical protein